MSRAEDIADVASKIQAIREEGESLLADYAKTEKRLSDDLRNLIKRAGIFDEYSAKEIELTKAQAEKKARIDKMNVEIQRLVGVRDYLLSREGKDPDEIPEKSASTEPAPEPEVAPKTSGQEPMPPTSQVPPPVSPIR